MIRTLLDQMQQPGEYELEFDVSDFPGGLYFIRMQAGDLQATGEVGGYSLISGGRLWAMGSYK